ncbi:MAG: peroxiredoxin [Pseudomonadota bacterium]|nr:MAG: alkyl hydroperoxide reductase [Pseudomonadota bacterium]
MISPGMKLPEFKATACVSLEKGKEFQEITDKSHPGKWLVLYTYPKDFTFVCPTEIVEFDKKLSAFAERDAVVLGGSTDNEYSHLAWRREHADLKDLKHPLLFWNPDMVNAFGVLHPQAGVALRATIIADPQGIVRFAMANDLSVGRNVDEVLRVLDALQTDELCPCNWKQGQETLTQQLKKSA